MFIFIGILFGMLLFGYFVNGFDLIKKYFILVISTRMQFTWMIVTFILAYNLFFIVVKTFIKINKGKV